MRYRIAGDTRSHRHQMELRMNVENSGSVDQNITRVVSFRKMYRCCNCELEVSL